MVRRTTAFAVLVFAIAACGSAATTSATATPTPTPSPTPSGPTGPPTAQSAVVGDTGLTGALTYTSVECGAPGLTGNSIVTFANPSDKNISIRMVVAAGSIQLRVDSGSGSTYKERDFMGTGVTAFDAANGATFNSQLTESTTPGPGTVGIGTLTSISGSIDCMHQALGSATITLSGGGADIVSGGLTSVRVICLNQSTGNVVQVFGIGQAGTSKESVALFVFATGFNLFFTPSTGPALYYAGQPGGTETLTGTGLHVDGVGLYKPATGSSTATVHVSGDATCGSSVTP
jgi:hypothetical protein